MAEQKSGGAGLAVFGAIVFVALWGVVLVSYLGAFLPVPPSL